MKRRGFIFGLGATLAVIRTPGLIMPVRSVEMIQFEFTASPQYELFVADILAVQKRIEAALFADLFQAITA